MSSDILDVQHNAGFFSCCTIRLERIIDYFNDNKKLPRKVVSNNQYNFYKPSHVAIEDMNKEFYREDIDDDIKYVHKVEYQYDNIEHQFIDYKRIDYKSINPFIKKYFSPSAQIETYIKYIINKYSIDIDNTCVVFFRGNDKSTEFKRPSIDSYIKATETYKRDNVKFLIQSDETEFIEAMSEQLDNTLILRDDIYHIRKDETSNCVKDLSDFNKRFDYLLKYLAITYIMSRCKYIICNTGNCCIWLAYFRGNAEGITQL